jgi:hypothetical protein
MKRNLFIFVVSILVFTFMIPGAGLAHNAGPCNGDGQDYAQHHIVYLAKEQMLGNDGHMPGAHKGFSVCQ